MWRVARILGVVAAVALILPAFGERRHEAAAPGPRLEDRSREVPADWASLPVVAVFDRARASSRVVREVLFSWVRETSAPLGDMEVRVREDVCGAGGSACAQSPPNLYDLRIGEGSTSFSCDGTPPFLRGHDPSSRSC